MPVLPRLQMQGLRLAILGDQRELARLPEASVSNPTLAFSLFVNAAKGLSSLQLSRNLGVQVKPAFVLWLGLITNSASTALTAGAGAGARHRRPPIPAIVAPQVLLGNHLKALEAWCCKGAGGNGCDDTRLEVFISVFFRSVRRFP